LIFIHRRHADGEALANALANSRTGCCLQEAIDCRFIVNLQVYCAAPEQIAFHETEVSGSYRAEMLIFDLPDGPHRIRVAVADSRGHSGEATARYSSADSIVLGGARVELSADREVYDAFHGQDSARLTFEIRGDDDRPFSGIGPIQLELLVDGVVRPNAAFVETAVPGRYAARVDLGALPHGTHRIVAVYRAAPGRIYFAQADVLRRVLELSW